ncbi:hypothetical protein [Lacticaseibacillus parakribbianus]|uniref:hypothetical protein n=1 Tax=Lacticaseibacillus parakribbianus TaxID=2970927 RepID=UPI0021CB59D3|nr:hypothetical protein [Lacticaseibacillus parakribbianus]
MRLAPATKVFMYMLTMSGTDAVSTDPVWQERYHMDPHRTIGRLIHRGLIHQVPDGYTLTPKGQAALQDIADWLWIHEYYLPDVIDFTRLRRHAWQPRLSGYPLLHAGLEAAAARHLDDSAYLAVILRHQLRLEYDTQHDRAAICTLMALIDQDLDLRGPVTIATFSYQTTWAKMTQFEKQMLKSLLSRLEWTLADFEMHFSAWLDQQPRQPRLFTRFELMTIVMYELSNNVGALTRLYASAAQRSCPASLPLGEQMLS